MTVETIRVFNEDGLKAFLEFIEATRAAEKAGDKPQSAPRELLTDPTKTESLRNNLSIDDGVIFKHRFEMASYLIEVLDPVIDEKLYDQVGLWAWIALFYFDQLRGKKTQRSEHFIPDEWAKQTPGQDLGYRHSVRTPVRVLRDYDEGFAQFLLTGRPTNQMGDIVEQFISRPKVFGSERVRATILALYQGSSGGIKPRAASIPSKDRKSNSGKGGIRRFATVYVPRVKLGYDIDEMGVRDIIEVCGAEISESEFAG